MTEVSPPVRVSVFLNYPNGDSPLPSGIDLLALAQKPFAMK